MRETISGETSQEAEHSPAAGGEQEEQGERPCPKETEKDRKARYRALVTGEFKDLFTADAQRIINERFKETRGLQETVAACRPVLERLGKRYGVDGGDMTALSAALDAEEARRAQEERQMAQLLAETAQKAAAERERALTEDIRARGSRPPENGAGAQRGVTAGIRVDKLTPAQRAQIAQRAMRGERVTFR